MVRAHVGRPRWRRPKLGFGGLALVLLACSPARPAGSPAVAVQNFYAAVKADDCATALSTLGTALRTRVAPDGSCAQLFHELREQPLERVLDTQVDGRNRRAQLVRIQLRGHVTAVILRVQAEGSAWKVFSL